MPSGLYTGPRNCLSNNLSPCSLHAAPFAAYLRKRQSASGVSGQVALATTQRHPHTHTRTATSDLLSQHRRTAGEKGREPHPGA